MPSLSKVFRKRAVVTGLVLAALAMVVLLRHNEPVYMGRTLGEWLKGFDQSEGDLEWMNSARAVDAMGTNALPHLVRRLALRESAMGVRIRKMLNGTGLLKLEIYSVEREHARVVTAFYVLRGAAAPALPQLRELLQDPVSSPPALQCLGFIGVPAIPAITSALEHPMPEARQYAANQLGAFHGAAAPAVPALATACRDSSPRVRAAAARALGFIRSRAEMAVPVLAACLQDPDAETRDNAIRSLAAFGEKARPAVPAIKAALLRSSQGGQTVLTQALLHIDADAAGVYQRGILTGEPVQIAAPGPLFPEEQERER